MKRRLIFAGAILTALAGLLAAGVWFGLIPLNLPSRSTYPARGVDVSAYQGKIDWPTLAAEDIDFAFIKATEGSAHTDARFAENWAAAQSTDLRIGAYHFFSFDSPGETQAAHFIETVPIISDMLSPVIDLEYYGDYFANPPDPAAVRAELDTMLARLEAHYGMSPILYATADSYTRYLAGGYPDNPIWIRNVLTSPTLSDGRTWTFWQYSNRGRLKGYDGEERYIDLNLFRGTMNEFLAFGR